ncbi:MAG: DUF3488 and transglutaminase-like domain-containing protein [Gemmataceae bacterium]|nr:DUF3488 and transglutaminase-like domain-containing protein [Gemmataceae bacterium]
MVRHRWERAFRLSFYGMLASACIVLGYTEHVLLPESAVVAALVLVALIWLYFKEGRWAVLSIPAANTVGLGVGIVALGWMGWRLGQEWLRPRWVYMDWVSLLVALLGPLAVVLMPVKLLRSHKHIGDYWWLHLLALGTVVLAAAMVDDLIGIVLIGIYATLAVINLRLLHMVRLAGLIAPLPQQPAVPVQMNNSGTCQGLGWARGGFCLLLAGLLAVPVYLVTPPSPLPPVRFGRPRIEVGYAADQMLNLTVTGRLETNRTPLFEVLAVHPDGSPATLPLDLRWRGRELRQYDKGQWSGGTTRLPTILPATDHRSPWQPPQLGPQQLVLTFHLRPNTRSLFLADPVAWRPQQPVPVVSLLPFQRVQPWHWLGDGTFFTDLENAEVYPYRQYWHPAEPPDLSPPFVIVEPDPGPLLRFLTVNPLPRVKDLADQLVQRWIRIGRLPPDTVDPALQRPRRSYHERLARLLCDYLRQEAGLRYSTELRLTRTDIDPVEDFLFHSQAGHCERFATALALLLRSQGIPTQLVLGCKGCEPLATPGHYLVRHEHAHAWVECLIEQYQPAAQAGLRPISRWLSLDPTPDADPAETAPTNAWWQRTGKDVQQWVHDYVLTYTPEQRQQSLAALGRIVRGMLPWLAVAVLLIGLMALLRRYNQTRVVRPLSPASPGHRCYELLATGQTMGIVLTPGETLAAWAQRLATHLEGSPLGQPYADVPRLWIDSYYAERFGGHCLSDQHWNDLRHRLQQLQNLLRRYPDLRGPG